MKSNLLSMIACPYHPEQPLHLDADMCEGDDIILGTLKCPACNRSFPIHASTPDLRPDEVRNQQITQSTGWIPGERRWNPKGLTRLITALKAPSKLRGSTTATEVHKDWQVLDIGCGSNPRGSVNMDVYIPDPLPPNFVLGSAELLPFRPKSFDLLTSQFVIEHVLEPAGFISAQVSRARKMVEIITDNSEWIGETWFRAFGTGRIFHDEHCYAWKKEYLDNLIRRLGYDGITTGYILPTETLITALSNKLARIPVIGIWFAPYLKVIITDMMNVD